MAAGKRLMVSAAALGLAASLGAHGSAQAAWRKAESDHFIVYGRSDKIVREYATMLEDFDDLLRTVHGRAKVDATPVRKLPIYLAPTQTELRRILPSANGYMAGFYSPTLTDVFAVVIKTESMSTDAAAGGASGRSHGQFVHLLRPATDARKAVERGCRIMRELGAVRRA